MAKRRSPRGAAGGARDRSGPRSVHEGLVGQRVLVGTPYLADARRREEYARDIAPRTEAALGKILAEQFPAGLRPAPRRILDLGAGTGAATAALRAHFGRAVEIVSVDRTPVSAHVRRADATDIAALRALGRFDLVVAAHLVNELYVGLPTEERIERLAGLVRAWCVSLSAQGGELILVEPALRETSRALLAVRDRLIANEFSIRAPCFFAGPCPALARERDWCHDAVVGTGGRRIDFSYLIVAAGDAREPAHPESYRVVSDLMKDKGRLRLFVCGSDGRHEVTRLDRDATDANAGMRGARRGDAVEIRSATTRADGLRVAADTTVEIRRR